MRKMIVILTLAITVFALAACGVAYVSDQPCAWCSDTPTKEVASETTDEEAHYYCESCSTTCFFCSDKKADNHYTNLLGLEVFVCGECYAEATGN